MGKPKKPTKEHHQRLHFINEWAAAKDMSQAQLCELLEVNKGSVSKWFSGGLPAEANLPRIAKIFGIGVDQLFRPPDEFDITTAINDLRSLGKQDRKDVIANLNSTLSLVKKRTTL